MSLYVPCHNRPRVFIGPSTRYTKPLCTVGKDICIIECGNWMNKECLNNSMSLFCILPGKCSQFCSFASVCEMRMLTNCPQREEINYIGFDKHSVTLGNSENRVIESNRMNTVV